MNSEESIATINLIQAMLGSVTQNWRAVFLQVENGRASVTFVLANESTEDREEIEEVEFEYQALQPSENISVTIAIDASPLQTLAYRGRMVFARKE